MMFSNESAVESLISIGQIINKQISPLEDCTISPFIGSKCNFRDVSVCAQTTSGENLRETLGISAGFTFV